MKNKLNNKDVKRLYEAMGRLRDDMAEMERKQELARWATEIQTPLSLADILPTFTKTALDRIRQSLGIRGASSLNKDKLVSILKEAIVANAAKNFRLLDTSQYHLLKGVVDNGGVTEVFAISDNQVEYFRDRGILFPGRCKGEKVLAVSTEIIVEFRKLDKQGLRNLVQENTEWVRLAHGILYYYGTIPFTALTAKIASLSKTPDVDTFRMVDTLVQNAIPYYGHMRIGSAGVSHTAVSDPEAVAREHAARPDVDYYPFTYDEIWRAGAEEFVEKSIAFKRFAKFIADHYGITAREADHIVEECVWMIQKTSEKPISEIFSFLQRRIEIDSRETAQQFAHHLMELNNNTRQWILKGHTPNELVSKERTYLRPLPSLPFPMPGVTDGKAGGRNSPCPCGSGKKYKKCCGRNV